jgi:tyrosyl-tRNA synthetase
VETISEKYQTPSVYCGYDPTSDSLHLGNLLSIIAMGRLSTIGLRPVFLIGGATAQIGDPSGKKKERPPLEKEVIYRNIDGITQDISRIYDNILKRI